MRRSTVRIRPLAPFFTSPALRDFFGFWDCGDYRESESGQESDKWAFVLFHLELHYFGIMGNLFHFLTKSHFALRATTRPPDKPLSSQGQLELCSQATAVCWFGPSYIFLPFQTGIAMKDLLGTTGRYNRMSPERQKWKRLKSIGISCRNGTGTTSIAYPI